MRNVASRSSQHSKMLGQPADWQTVCSSSDFTICCSSRYSGPIFAVVLIQDGFFSMGTLALRTSSRSILRPSGAIVTGSDYPPARTPPGPDQTFSGDVSTSEDQGRADDHDREQH